MDAKARSRGQPILGAQVISRVADVLRAVGRQEKPATLTGIASSTGLKVPTARRVLQALVAEGFLLFDDRGKTYHLGPDLIAIAAAGDEAFAVRDALMQACREVAAKTSDTVILMVRRGASAICVGRVEGKFHIRVVSLDAGSIRPLGAGSGSMALIAFLPPEECEGILRENEREYGRFGLTLGELVETAQEARREGFAFNPGRILPGVSGVGLPVYRDAEIVASISVVTIEQRLSPARRPEVIQIIREAVGKIQNFGADAK